MLRSLAIKEAAFGAQSTEVAVALDELIKHYSGQLRIKAALSCLERRVAIAEAIEGPASITLAPMLRELAGCLVIMERPTEAEPLLHRALAILEAAAPADEKETMWVLDSLVWALATMDRLEEARVPLLRSLAIKRRRFVEDPGKLVQPLERYVDLFRRGGRLVEGVNLIIGGMEFDTSDLPEAAIMLLNLAELLSSERHVAEASNVAKLSLQVIGRMLRPGNESAIDSLRRLPRERKIGFLERARIVADPDHAFLYPHWAPEQAITACFWNREKSPRE